VSGKEFKSFSQKLRVVLSKACEKNEESSLPGARLRMEVFLKVLSSSSFAYHSTRNETYLIIQIYRCLSFRFTKKSILNAATTVRGINHQTSANYKKLIL